MLPESGLLWNNKMWIRQCVAAGFQGRLRAMPLHVGFLGQIHHQRLQLGLTGSTKHIADVIKARLGL